MDQTVSRSGGYASAKMIAQFSSFIAPVLTVTFHVGVKTKLCQKLKPARERLKLFHVPVIHQNHLQKTKYRSCGTAKSCWWPSVKM